MVEKGRISEIKMMGAEESHLKIFQPLRFALIGRRYNYTDVEKTFHELSIKLESGDKFKTDLLNMLF